MELIRFDAGRCVVARGHEYESPHCVPIDVSESNLRHHHLRIALQPYYVIPLTSLFSQPLSSAELEPARIAFLAKAWRQEPVPLVDGAASSPGPFDCRPCNGKSSLVD